MIVLLLILLLIPVDANAFSKKFKDEDSAREYIKKNHSSGQCVEIIKGKKSYWVRSCR